MTTGGTAETPSALCDSVYEFMDGEMGELEADRFRHHMAGCERCAQRLGDGWLLDERWHQLRPARAVPKDRPREQRPRWVPAFALLAGAAAAVAVAVHFAPGPGTQSGLVAAVPPRWSKTRVSGSGAAPYRELAPSSPAPVMLGTKRQDEDPRLLSVAEERKLLDQIEALEGRRDFLGAANTYVEWGRAEQAARYLGRIPASPDKDVLEAAIALERRTPAQERVPSAEQALEATDRALRKNPRLAPALWNRALALARLELPAATGNALKAAAQLGEQGWSAEAAADARDWQERIQERHNRYLTADGTCRQMIESGTPMPDELVQLVPGLARACLYKSVQAALSSEQVRGLLPLAVQLDRLDGGHWLEQYVGSVARKGFAQRRPMAELYRRLALRQTASGEEVEGILESLRRSGEQDILLGALGDVPLDMVKKSSARYREALAEAAKAKDPWWVQLAAEQQGLAQRQDEHPEQALATLMRAAGDCKAQRPPRALDIRCAGLRRQIARNYTVMNRTGEAREQNRQALELAALQNDWGMELSTLAEQALSDRQGGHLALALAYYEEALQREPDGCRTSPPTVEPALDWDFVYSNLAQVHIRMLDFAAARRDLERARSCRNVRGLQRFMDMADQARIYPQGSDDVREFETLLAGVSANLSPAGRVQAMHLRGRYQLEVDPVLGTSLLRQAIHEAEKLPDEETARRARTYGYTSLILAAGKGHRYEEAFSLFAEELSVPAPATCTLAVAVEEERTLVVVRGSSGATRGAYDAGRTERLMTAEGLVPEALLAQLQGCATVRVIARPPVVGMDGLLPDAVSWSYLGPRTAVSAGGGGEESLLLVTRPSPPPELGLEDIGAFPLPPTGPGTQVVELKDGDATPDRVLEAMERASVIYLHAHGVLRDSSDPALLALSQDSKQAGKYALTAGDVRARKLRRRPGVVLVSCDAAHSGPYLHQVFSLPTAFLEAGARFVFAARAPIPNDEASAFFAQLMEDVRRGTEPAVALRDAKRRWATRDPNSWVEHVLLFQASGG